MSRPKKLTEAKLGEVAMLIAANPSRRPTDLDEAIASQFGFSLTLARQARAKLKNRVFGAVMPDTKTELPRNSSNSERIAPDKLPDNPMEARQEIIDSLYDQMNSAIRPDDRIKAGKELARLLGYHREDVQDHLSGMAKAREDDAEKCTRIITNLRQALGLVKDADAIERDVLAVRVAVAAGSPAAQAVLEVPANRN